MDMHRCPRPAGSGRWASSLDLLLPAPPLRQEFRTPGRCCGVSEKPLHSETAGATEMQTCSSPPVRTAQGRVPGWAVDGQGHKATVLAMRCLKGRHGGRRVPHTLASLVLLLPQIPAQAHGHHAAPMAWQTLIPHPLHAQRTATELSVPTLGLWRNHAGVEWGS